MRRIVQIGSLLARPELVFYSLLWLMLLLVSGTVAQRFVGLYVAQQAFFSSWIWWGGWVPLPGGYTTMAVLFLGLTAKLLFKSPWKVSRLGINILHLGAMLLFLGGFLTALFAEEGNMVLSEGGKSGIVSDYHRVELVLTDIDQNEEVAFPEEIFLRDTILKSTKSPFQIELLHFFRNVTMEKRESPDPQAHGFAKIFDLKELPRNREEEKNVAGAVLKITGIAPETDGLYSVFEEMPIQQTLSVGERKYRVAIRREQRPLPFSIELLDFKRENYAATDKAKSYRSEVLLQDGSLEQRSLIKMNQPLRYKGYTFYQASFIEGLDKETTVLAVVKNVGRLFPYFSSIVMCFGLLLHLLLQIPRLIPKKQ